MKGAAIARITRNANTPAPVIANGDLRKYFQSSLISDSGIDVGVAQVDRKIYQNKYHGSERDYTLNEGQVTCLYGL